MLSAVCASAAAVAVSEIVIHVIAEIIAAKCYAHNDIGSVTGRDSRQVFTCDSSLIRAL